MGCMPPTPHGSQLASWAHTSPRHAGAGWFWIDAPSSLPVELITIFAPPGAEENKELSFLRFLRMFRLLRLLRLLKVDVYVAKVEDNFEVNLISLRILGMVFRLMFIVHILGCFWFYIAVQSVEAGADISWAISYNDGAAIEGTVDVQYLYSVYWALTTLTTVGYGDIIPQNDVERAYCLFAMLVGAMMFGCARRCTSLWACSTSTWPHPSRRSAIEALPQRQRHA